MKFAILLFICSMVLSTASCNKKSAESTSQAHAKEFHLKGKVVSIDNRAQMVNVESEAIPGFMDAMTMPYKVKPESELEQLHPGDAVSADLLVEDDGAWLQNIHVIAHSAVRQTK